MVSPLKKVRYAVLVVMERNGARTYEGTVPKTDQAPKRACPQIGTALLNYFIFAFTTQWGL